MNHKIAVLGAGSFGTCLGNQLAKNGHEVMMFARNEKVVHSINNNHTNDKYFPEIILNQNLSADSNFNDISQYEHIVIAVPTQHMRSALKNIPSLKDKYVTVAAKGIEIGSLKFPMEIISEVHPEVSKDDIAVLSGPSFAIEVLEGTPTAVSIASKNPEPAKRTQDLFHAPHFRAYISNDPLGLEVCGALKNVIAIAAGACNGFKFGKNSHAALVTRGLGEIIAIGSKLGAKPETFFSLGGVGDLFLTCSSEKSRNYRVGLGLAAGLTKEQIIEKTKTTAEGIPTTKSAFSLSKKLGLKSTIIASLYGVLYEQNNIAESVRNLLSSEASEEFANRV